MNDSLFHARRIVLSYLYEAMLRVISWKLSQQKRFALVLYFAIGAGLCGVLFTIWPAHMASYFGFSSLNEVALNDVRAYYGTMLIALAGVLAWSAKTTQGARYALLVITAFAIGSAIGRCIGFANGMPVDNIHGALAVIELLVAMKAVSVYRNSDGSDSVDELPILNPTHPEQFKPLSQQNFNKPYAYYKMLRDEYPVYKMPTQGYYCISRYDDVCAMAKNTTEVSSKIMEILVTGKPKDPNFKGKTPVERLGELGVVPVDVLAIQDDPIHIKERKIGHAGFNAKYVKSLEGEVTQLCDEMMDECMARGNIEFVQDFAWRLPMRLIIRLLGFPESDYEQIKTWCMNGIRALSGTAPRAELVGNGAGSAQFMRYLWRQYLLAKANPKENFTGILIKEAADPGSIMTDQRAVATLLQLLIAGSDSSASSMGNAIRMLAKYPALEQELRDDPDKVNNFIEEVFRTESAFQGHFRVTNTDITLHGITIPKSSRVFLMWASANRDERFWDNPEVFDMNRAKVKKHLTFGHGAHACIGRELARMEIKIVIKQLLARTSKIEIVGDTPFEASMFARTLLRLPLAFLPCEKDTQTNQDNVTPITTTIDESEQPASVCPFTGKGA